MSTPPREVHGTCKYVNYSVESSIDPSPRILLFIESWIKKGFEDPELICSSRIREFVRSVTGSRTMEVKARQIEILVDDPAHVGQNERALTESLTRGAFVCLGPPPQSRKLSPLTK